MHSCPVAFQLHTHLLFANRKSENDYWSHPLFPDLTRHYGRYGGIINHICLLFLEEARLYKIKQHCVCVCARSQSLSRVQRLAALWTVADQVPLSMGFPRQEYWSRLPFLFPGDLANLGIDLCLLHLLNRQADSLPLSHLRSPNKIICEKPVKTINGQGPAIRS